MKNLFKISVLSIFFVISGIAYGENLEIKGIRIGINQKQLAALGQNLKCQFEFEKFNIRKDICYFEKFTIGGAEVESTRFEFFNDKLGGIDLVIEPNKANDVGLLTALEDKYGKSTHTGDRGRLTWKFDDGTMTYVSDNVLKRVLLLVGSEISSNWTQKLRDERTTKTKKDL